MIHYVTVGVALSRPPKVDEWRRYCVVAATPQEAELIAQQMAACTSVMPVESRWESSHRAGPVDPFGADGCTCWTPPWSDDLVSPQQDEMDVPYGRPPEPVWQLDDTCPHHSENNAAFVAATGADPRPTLEPADCPPGVHSINTVTFTSPAGLRYDVDTTPLMPRDGAAQCNSASPRRTLHQWWMGSRFRAWLNWDLPG